MARAVALAMLLGALASGEGATSAVVPGPLITGAIVTDALFSPNGDHVRDRALLALTLDRPAIVTLTVVDFDKHVVRHLVTSQAAAAGTWHWNWAGRNDQGKLVPDGPYRLIVSARDQADPGGAAEVLARQLAKSPVAPFTANPRAITVFVNPGHGPPDIGAIHHGIYERKMNLDTARRLQQMLIASGVRVIIARTTDRAVNVPAVDVNGDGMIANGTSDKSDEGTARNDIANEARADLYVGVEYNASNCGCAHGPQTFINSHRAWDAENRALATAVQKAHVQRLRAFSGPDWSPMDRGLGYGWYYQVRPYDPPHYPRPSLMPAFMAESLFIDWVPEADRVRQPRVRTAIAAAYFDGITKWLNSRAYGAHYDVLAAPSSATTSQILHYSFDFTNTGNQPTSGWVLEARYVRHVPHYDGSKTPGTLLASLPVPNGIAPGDSTLLQIDVPAPAVAGHWLVKFDVHLPDGRTLSRHGVVAPQLGLTTAAP